MTKTNFEKNEIRNKLKMAGFVRVDGLRAVSLDGVSFVIKSGPSKEWDSYSGFVTAGPGLYSGWDSNNGFIVVVILAELWLGFFTDEETTRQSRCDLISELGLEKRSIYVPCSNGESLEIRDIFRRLANPDWSPCDD